MTWAERLLSLSHVGRFLATRYRQIEGAKAASGSVPATATRASLFMMADLLLGWLAIRTFHWGWRDLGWDLTVEDALLSSTDAALFYLRQLMTWLMGAPAGLKLNAVLSQSLGKFFLYHIHLWRTFLQVVAPFISDLLHVSLRSGFLPLAGFSFQICVLQDCLNLVTFHVHCFYSYARRIFLSQTSGLKSLWRLFRGKKYNPLRDRVDTLPHPSVEQLFVGTVGFTILLFLYPTTLVFFVIFGVLESVTVLVNLILSGLVGAITNLGDTAFRLKGSTSTHACWVP